VEHLRRFVSEHAQRSARILEATDNAAAATATSSLGSFQRIPIRGAGTAATDEPRPRHRSKLRVPLPRRLIEKLRLPAKLVVPPRIALLHVDCSAMHPAFPSKQPGSAGGSADDAKTTGGTSSVYAGAAHDLPQFECKIEDVFVPVGTAGADATAFVVRPADDDPEQESGRSGEHPQPGMACASDGPTVGGGMASKRVLKLLRLFSSLRHPDA